MHFFSEHLGAQILKFFCSVPTMVVPLWIQSAKQTLNMSLHGLPKLHNTTNKKQSMAMFIVQKKFSDRREVYES